jgi:FixJ family two-component response regulator
MGEAAPIVYVIDDDISIREALRNLFRSVGLAVETFHTAKEFLSSQRPDVPSCLVLDVRLPGVSGLDLQRQLVEADVGIPIIFITGHGDIQMSVRAMKAGAWEFLTKPFRDQDLLDAVQAAIERNHSDRLQQAETIEARKRHQSLTSREQEVLALVLRGLLNKQIADELKISEATVKLHRGRLMQKMGAESIADLIRMGEKLRIEDRQRAK